MTSKAEAIGLEEIFELTDHLETGLTLNIKPVGTDHELKFIMCETYTLEKFNNAKDALRDFVNACMEEE